MKAHLMKIPIPAEQSFSARHEIVPHLYNHWHYHPELELVYFIKGTGRQFIGDHIHHFKPTDMILIGSNLPHWFRCEEKYLRKNSNLKTEALLVHFTPDSLGEGFFKLPEHRDLHRLFEKAQQGVRIKNQTRSQVAEYMHQLIDAKGGERVIILLQILHTIAHSRQTKTVCSKGLEFHYNDMEADRMNNIYQFIMRNFTKEITLEQIAKVAHISPNSFCRYFKSRLKKTFSQFLIEVRIGHACKLLAESQITIADVCYESGFNNFSNFNRHFKAVTGKTPMAHRKHYQELVK